MVRNNKKVLIIISIFILINGCKQKDVVEQDMVHNNYSINQINQFVSKVMEAIKREDIDYIEKVLYNGTIEYNDHFDYYYKPKDEVIKQIKNKGKLYSILFDTEGIYEYMSKYEFRGKDMKPSPVDDLKMLYPDIQSVKERINNRKNIRVHKLEVIDKDKNIIRCYLIDDYEIEMKKKSPLSEIIYLKKVDIIFENNEIYLYSLSFDTAVFGW